ncbi:hypothetical protein VNO80_18544 [Phaseolus coccineus]|uniref:Uncharacterized protein n=1 Tax=Phaseolus coccineus TaxID=3886 RepID=A0AAN9QWK0_PHACN
MDYVQNMDRDFEADNLSMFIDWNDDQFQPTFLQTDIPLTGLEDANLMEHFNSQTQLHPLPPTVVVESMTEIRDPISSSAEALTFVPNPLPPLVPNTPLLNAPQINNPLSSAENGAVPSLQSQDITLAGYLNQLSELQNANSVGHQSIPHHDEQNSTNQLSIPNTIVNNNYNVININQSSSYPALVHQTPTNSERAHSTGAFASPTGSTPEQFQFSASDVYGAQYFPNYTQSLQPFPPGQNHIDNASELQQMQNLHSQDSRMSVYPTCPRSEPFSNLQPGLVTMPPNPFQPGYRSILSDPAAPSGSSVIYDQNSILFATSSNSFASGSSVLPMYPQLHQHQHPHVMMPYDQGQQSGSSMPQWSQIGEYNQRMATHNLQRQTSTSSQTLISRFLGHSSAWTTEGTNSRVPNSRDAGIAPILRLQPEATVLPNEVHISHDIGTSSARNQPSDAIQRILNMNPSRMVSRNIPSITTDQSGSMPTERIPYVPPRRGRPPKRRDPIESYSQRAKVSSETGRPGSSSTSQRPQRTPNSMVVNTNSNALLSNPPSAPRNFDNAIYDLEFERQGQPLDPHLRFFKPPPGNYNLRTDVLSLLKQSAKYRKFSTVAKWIISTHVL